MMLDYIVSVVLVLYGHHVLPTGPLCSFVDCMIIIVSGRVITDRVNS